MALNNSTYLDRLINRGVDEFIGICKGVLFDGVITKNEALNLMVWLNANPLVADKWPASGVLKVLQQAVDEDAFTAEIDAELLALLVQLTGDPETFFSGDNAASQLPLCDPPPPVFFKGAVFGLTGNMAIGSRKDMTALLESLGAEVLKNDLRRDTTFLVVGDVGSSTWLHSIHGRKIDLAVKFRDVKKTGIAIISEQHLLEFVE